jgi:hypothetical protein
MSDTGGHRIDYLEAIESVSALTRMFREITVRIEQRLASEESRRKVGA